MAAEGASHFLGTPSEAQTFPRRRASPLPTPLRKESDGPLPQSEMRPPRRKAGAAGSRVKGQGIPGWPPSEPGKLAPVRTLPQCPVGTLAFSRKCHGGWRWEVRRPKLRVKFRPGEGCLEMGEGQWFSSVPHRSPPVPTPAGEERPAPPGEVSWEGLLQEGGDSDEEIWQRPHRSGPLHRVR